MNRSTVEPFEFDNCKFQENYKEFSECGKYVIVVGVKADKTFTFQLSDWRSFESDNGGYAYWVEKVVGGTYQSFEDALKDARNMLQQHQQ